MNIFFNIKSFNKSFLLFWHSSWTNPNKIDPKLSICINILGDIPFNIKLFSTFIDFMITTQEDKTYHIAIPPISKVVRSHIMIIWLLFHFISARYDLKRKMPLCNFAKLNLTSKPFETEKICWEESEKSSLRQSL